MTRHDTAKLFGYIKLKYGNAVDENFAKEKAGLWTDELKKYTVALVKDAFDRLSKETKYHEFPPKLPAVAYAVRTANFNKGQENYAALLEPPKGSWESWSNAMTHYAMIFYKGEGWPKRVNTLVILADCARIGASYPDSIPKVTMEQEKIKGFQSLKTRILNFARAQNPGAFPKNVPIDQILRDMGGTYNRKLL